MDPKEEIVTTMQQGEIPRSFDLNIIVREVVGDGDTYFVAECVEMPGCVSDGATVDEAKRNVEDAMRLCLSVILEDAMKHLTVHKPLPDLRRVVGQGRLRVHATPELAYA